MEVKVNKDNDLKYRKGLENYSMIAGKVDTSHIVEPLYDPRSPEELEKIRKKQAMMEAGTDVGQLEYFTE